jgi:hypothetical protein
LFCFAAMLLPTVATTFGLGVTHTGNSGGLKVVVQQGLALRRVGAGQADAIHRMCARIPRNAAVVIVDWPTASQFAQVVRGMCDLPTAWMSGQPVSSVDAVLGSIAATGWQPVLLADSPGHLAGFTGTTTRVLDLSTTEDPHQLTQLPRAPQAARYQVWLTVPAATDFGT